MEALTAGLKEIGEDPSTVDIFLTHLHADHSGLSADIISDDRHVFISETDAEWFADKPDVGVRWAGISEGLLLAGMPLDMVEDMANVNPAVKYAPPSNVRYTAVEDGDILSFGDYVLRCTMTSGHSPGHMCLWEENSGIMFTGDHVLFDITPNITTWPTVEDSLGNYLDSLRMVQEYPVKTALPGHRKSGDFHKRIDELFKHHDVRLAEVVGIVSDNPGLTAYEIAGRMRWKIRAVNWDVFPVSQKAFAVGECMSHLDYLLLRGSVRLESCDGVFRYYKGA